MGERVILKPSQCCSSLWLKLSALKLNCFPAPCMHYLEAHSIAATITNPMPSLMVVGSEDIKRGKIKSMMSFLWLKLL
uniref:Uncharacterized protein n=1 Tax=Triticum urartu TaxID=4572 RepID=A0A8R7QZL9_TRIUA